MLLAIAALLAASARAEWLCANAANWDDFCPITGSAYANCTPYAAPLTPPVDYAAVRRALIADIFGSPSLPSSRMPDAITQVPAPQAAGCTCSTLGLCSVNECRWSNNMTKLVFTIAEAVNASYTLTLNSTVFYTLNTSGVAPINYPAMGPAEMPGNGSAPAFPSMGPGKTLLLFHNGHNRPCNQSGCVPDFDGVIDWANQVGFDVMAFQLPLFQCNAIPGVDCEHAWFEQWEQRGVHTMRFFLEPVVRAINYATEVLGYSQIIMAGLSGGGWTTTMLAAIDSRIQLSIPIAGSIPCDFAHFSWDYEQYCNRSWAMVANYTTLYALAALESNRYSLQILHEQDPCCYHACGRHDRIRAYNSWVASQVQGIFATAVTVGNVHEVNPRDKTIVAALAGRLMQTGRLDPADVAALPFNLLNGWY